MYRAYDMTTEWMGPARDSLDEALADKAAHEAGCREQGGFADAIIVRPDPDTEGRCVTIGGRPVWPPRSKSLGTVEWR
jgi:hypothetical protein